MSCNNCDYEFTKAVCHLVNLSFEIRSDHLKSLNHFIWFHSMYCICCSLISCFSILVSTWATHNPWRCCSCGWSAQNQCGYIVSLQCCPRRSLCLPSGFVQLWSVAFTTMCTFHCHFRSTFYLMILYYCLVFHLVFSLFVVCLCLCIIIEIFLIPWYFPVK